MKLARRISLRLLLAFFFISFAFAQTPVEREKIYRDKAMHASPIGSPDVFQIIWSSRYLTADDATRRQEALPYETIRLERTPCYGSWPVYSVAFHKDGSAELNAAANMPQLGRFSGNIRITEFARMCYVLERLGYQ